MDSAKAIAAVASHGGTVWDYIGDDLVPGPILPIVTVPTTAGTGSETTPFAVFTSPETRRKDGMYSRYFFPRVSVLDPEAYVTLPPQISAETGMDALAHAIEGFTSQSNHSVCDALALEAVRLISQSLIAVVRDGEDLAARENMAVASALAGIVITYCGVGAAHGLGMSLGGLYGIAHGRAIATLLAPVMQYNSSSVEQFSALEDVLLGQLPATDEMDNIDSAAAAVAWLAGQIGIPATLTDLGIHPGQIDEILDDCLDRQDMLNNARPMNRAEAEQLLRSLLQSV